jgi:hypothetical protein
MDESEWDLTLRLELARRNSQNQHSKETVEQPQWDGPVEETIYEGCKGFPPKHSPGLIDLVSQTLHQNRFGQSLGLLVAALAKFQRHRQITRCLCPRLISTKLPNVRHEAFQGAARVVHVALRLSHPV